MGWHDTTSQSVWSATGWRARMMVEMCKRAGFWYNCRWSFVCVRCTAMLVYRQRLRDLDRDWERERETDRGRDRQAETETETDTQTDRPRSNVHISFFCLLYCTPHRALLQRLLNWLGSSSLIVGTISRYIWISGMKGGIKLIPQGIYALSLSVDTHPPRLTFSGSLVLSNYGVSVCNVMLLTVTVTVKVTL